MRIPRKRLYRAFPELDRFSDEQCERFLQRVRIRGSYRPVVLVTVGFVSVASLILVAGIVVAAWTSDLGQDVHRSLWLRFGPRVDLVALAGMLTPSIAVPPFAGLFVRDVVLRHYLRKAVRMQIERVSCRRCKYLLIGQRVSAGLVTCPECGERNALSTLGVTAEDLVPPTAGEDRLADIPAA